VGHKKGRADREESGERNKRGRAVWWGGKGKEKRRKKGKQGPHGPQVFTGECAPVRATEC